MKCKFLLCKHKKCSYRTCIHHWINRKIDGIILADLEFTEKCKKKKPK